MIVKLNLHYEYIYKYAIIMARKVEKTTERESYDKSRKIILFLPAEGLI